MNRERFLALVGATLLRLIFLTLRLRFVDHSGFTKNHFENPVIMCFWHNRILGITLAFLRQYPFGKRGGVTVLASSSKDGEILAQFIRAFGMDAVRGSSSRRGSQALRELIKLLEDRQDIAITPDGPRGPRYSLSPGAVSLAQLTGAPIVPVYGKFSRFLQMKTWDGFLVPLPFSTISVTVGEPIFVPPDLDEESFEMIRKNIETLLKNETD